MLPRITFGMIVLNGEPFTRYNLRSIYPWAHQIVVVEGACRAAAAVAAADGHSRDGTLAVLRQFRATEDPEGKVIVVTAEDEGHPDGFWPGEKDQMSQAYARRATGNYLWQVDSDEFYPRDAHLRVQQMLAGDPGITEVAFPLRTFSAGLEYMVDGPFVRRYATDGFHRLFSWAPGFRYVSHRPPTVYDGVGRDLRSLNPVAASALTRMGVYMHHYEQLFPKQVTEKCEYYARSPDASIIRADVWARDCYLRLGDPFRVHMSHSHRSWLERFRGGHPEQVCAMMAAVRAGLHAGIVCRPTDDIEALLRSRRYALQCTVARAWSTGQVAAYFGRKRAAMALDGTGFLRWYRTRRCGP